jgi:ubiquinone/menaquinone biosynthesis C-methylase UbiE
MSQGDTEGQAFLRNRVNTKRKKTKKDVLHRKDKETIDNEDEVRNYYNSKSKTYDEAFDTLYFRVYDVVTWKYLEPCIPLSPNASVLDAGGGTGRWTVKVAQKGCKVILMDISEKMLKVAAEKIRRDNLQDRVVIKKGNIGATGFADESFDLIICEHALFLFKKPDTLLRELVRVLKRNGRLFISVQNRYVQVLSMLPEMPSPEKMDEASKFLASEQHNFMDKEGKIGIYTWTPDEFRVMLERNGLHVERIVGKGVAMPLRISKDLFMKKNYSQKLLEKLLQLELAFCEKADAIALAGHLQAIARKL